MSGPFGNAVCKYLLRGADSIVSVSLGIEWLDAAFCSTQPDNRNDYLGKEYLVNNLYSYFFSSSLSRLTKSLPPADPKISKVSIFFL
jgi:hypothetical protein